MIKESAVSDDFTFPIITENNSLYHLHYPSFKTPSFWCVSSPLPEQGKLSFEQKTHQRRSFSTLEGDKRTDNLTRDLAFLANFNGSNDVGFFVDEDKMDMLWEDFNDELRQPSSDGKEADKPNGVFSDSNKDVMSMADLGCVHAIKVSKSRSLMPHRKPSLLVMLKILKKLFLIHSSHCPRKTSRIMP
ncbi:hypothetical protein AAC387_Pa05g3200 [Persea americana]